MVDTSPPTASPSPSLSARYRHSGTPDDDVPIVAEAKVGEDWGEMRKID